ncbi:MULTISPECIES: hypothetical protein [Sediminibacillus]|uniref:hypothetical protein n=1 Tax=Sediminibacillus TaxID=482460 RepID=UPI0012950D42|nr:hypothetical protein [Sediminibacillus terrae]
MDEVNLDIQEVKRLKKKLLVQYNLVMLLLFVLFRYLAENGEPSLLIGGSLVLIWIIVAVTLYTLKTGRYFGTKASIMVQKFDRRRLGEKRWKRRRMTEAVIISVICIFISVFVWVKGINPASVDFPGSTFPFIGAWVGYNIGEIVRIYDLKG